MIFQIFRHHNKVLVEQFLDNLNETLDSKQSLNHSKTPTTQQLKAMQSLAQMREIADSNGMGFAASFVSPDGSHYTTTNLPNVNYDNFIIQHLLSVPFVENDQKGRVQLVETTDGVQLQIIPEVE